MIIQYKFNINKMYEAFIPVIEEILKEKTEFDFGPFDDDVIEESGLIFEGEGEDLKEIDTFMQKYLDENNINYVRKQHA